MKLDLSWAFLSEEEIKDQDLMKKMKHASDDGLFLFFRKMCLKSQKRFAQMLKEQVQPVVFLHGNPHIDNLVAIGNQTGLVDFDRARLGPYSFDLIRCLCSMALKVKMKNKEKTFLKDSTIQAFFAGYVVGFEKPENSPYIIPALMNLPIKKWQKHLDAYMAHGKKWAKKLKKDAIKPTSESWNFALSLLESYLDKRHELDHIKKMKVDSIALCKGSLGHPHYGFYLSSQSKELESRLIDIKPVFKDPDGYGFESPFIDKGIQMIFASKLYASHLESDLAAFNYNGVSYWGRKIPIDKRQFEGEISAYVMDQLAMAMGSQLGMGHRKSCFFCEPRVILDHLENHNELFVQIAYQMNKELIASFETFKNRQIETAA